MFNLFNNETKKENLVLREALFDINKLKIDIKDLQNQIDKLEIKALESRKLYYKKLKSIYGDNEIADTDKEKDIYSTMFLKDNGSL